jgi:multicomponent Na+:H+ antiporter subunit E
MRIRVPGLRIPLRTELPLLVWLVLVWGALWRDFSPGNLLFGALIAFAVVNVFYLPPVELSGRFNVFYATLFAGRFFGELAVASGQVFWLALVRGRKLKNAVIAVRLRSQSDLLITATGHALTLIPGTLVVEVDRSTSTLYLHCLNVSTAEEADAIRDSVLATEAWLIRTMGTREDLALLRTERRLADRYGQRSPAERPSRQGREPGA